MTRLLFMGALIAGLTLGLQVTTAEPQDNIPQLLGQLESDTDRSNASFNSALDKTRLNDTQAEDDILNYIRAFEDAMDRLKNRVDDREFSTVQAREVLNKARNINRFMLRHRLESAAETDWVTIRNSLSRLARAYAIRWRW